MPKEPAIEAKNPTRAPSFPIPATTTNAVPAPFNLSPCSDPIILNRFYECLQQSRQHEERIRGLERECAQIFAEWRTAMPQAGDVITVPPLSPLPGTPDPFQQKMEADFMRCPRLRLIYESMEREDIKLSNVKREMALYEQMLLLLGVPIPEAVYQNPKVMQFSVSPDVPVVLECQNPAKVPVVDVFAPTCVPCPEVAAEVFVPTRVPCQQVASAEKVVAVPVLDEVFVPNRVPCQEVVSPYPQKSDFRQDAEPPVVEEVIDTPCAPRQEHTPFYLKVKQRRARKWLRVKRRNRAKKCQRVVLAGQHECKTKSSVGQLPVLRPRQQVAVQGPLPRRNYFNSAMSSTDPIRSYLVQIDRNGRRYWRFYKFLRPPYRPMTTNQFHGIPSICSMFSYSVPIQLVI